MGMVIEPHEIYFGSFFERFNMRFGPAQPAGLSVWHSGGINEIVALQKEFEIFREGRPFVQSAALLGLTGPNSSPANDRWLQYLLKLPEMNSDLEGVKGDERIVRAIAENLGRETPLPCFMRAYDGRTREPGLVVVTEENPVFYLASVTFLTLSLPMRPSTPAPAPAPTPAPTPTPTPTRTTRPRGQTGTGTSTRAPRRKRAS